MSAPPRETNTESSSSDGPNPSPAKPRPARRWTRTLLPAAIVVGASALVVCPGIVQMHAPASKTSASVARAATVAAASAVATSAAGATTQTASDVHTPSVESGAASSLAEVPRLAIDLSSFAAGSPGSATLANAAAFHRAPRHALASVKLGTPRAHERRLAHGVPDADAASRPTGSLDREATARLARREVEQWASRYCYRRALRDDPLLAGRLDVRLDIEPNGTVSSVQVQPTLNHDLAPAVQFHDCVQRNLRRGSFPPPRGGRAEFAFALQLSPGERF